MSYRTCDLDGCRKKADVEDENTQWGALSFCSLAHRMNAMGD